jgi:hypothetical protein
MLISLTMSTPDKNGATPGCAGCHTLTAGIVTAQALANLQVQITLTGVTTGKKAGELVNSSGTVVAQINSTSSNPFILTAPSAGTYTVNAGYKSPSMKWGTTTVVVTVTDVDDQTKINPSSFELYNNYPNPFNPSTNIEYSLPERADVTVTVYTVLGQLVTTLVNTTEEVGYHKVAFNASDLSSGTYIYQIKAVGSNKNFTDTKKMVLLK